MNPLSTMLVVGLVAVGGCSSDDPETAEPPACTARCGAGTAELLQVTTLGDGGLSTLGTVFDLAVDEAGTAWVLTGERLIPVRREGATLSLDAEAAVSLAATPATTVVAGGGALWVGSEAGLVRAEPGDDGWSFADAPGPWSGAVELEYGADGPIALTGDARVDASGAQALGFDGLTDCSSDGSVVVSRDATAIAWRTGSDWSQALSTTSGFEALAHVEAVDAEPVAGSGTSRLVVVGARGLHRFRLADGQLTPLGAVELPAPWGVPRGWDDEDPATVHDVAFGADAVWATTVYGAYLMRFPRSGEALGAGEVVPVQPLVTDDDYEEDSLGTGLGYDPTEHERLARLVPDGDGMWVVSNLWRYVGHSAGGLLQQGQGGVLTLGGAYSAVTSPDGRHVYTGAWNAPDPGVWVVGEDRQLSPGAPVAGLAGRPVNYGAPDVAVSSDGAQVYAIDDEFNRLHVYDRDADSGALTWRADVGDELPLSLLVGVAAAPDGTAVWTADFEAGALVAYRRDPASGEVSVGALYVDGEAGIDGLHGAEDPLPSPDGRHLYVVSYRDSAVARFDRGTPGEPVFVEAWRPEGASDRLFGIEAGAFTGDGTRLVLVSPVTDRLFVVGRDKSGALQLLDDQSIAALNPGPALNEHQANPGRVVISPDGTVVVPLRRWDAIAMLRLDGGQLSWTSTLVPPDGVRRWPNGVALHPDGGTAWIATALGDSLITLRVQDRGPGAPDGCEGTCP